MSLVGLPAAAERGSDAGRLGVLGCELRLVCLCCPLYRLVSPLQGRNTSLPACPHGAQEERLRKQLAAGKFGNAAAMMRMAVNLALGKPPGMA